MTTKFFLGKFEEYTHGNAHVVGMRIFTEDQMKAFIGHYENREEEMEVWFADHDVNYYDDGPHFLESFNFVEITIQQYHFLESIFSRGVSFTHHFGNFPQP